MQSRDSVSASLPAASQSYQYSLVNDVLFSWLRFYKASNEPHSTLEQRTYFRQKVLDTHHLAAQITDFESALLSKRTQLVVGKLSFLLYSSFQRQRVDQSDINQWLDLGEIEEAPECLGFWLSYYLDSGKCIHLPATLWTSDHAWIRAGVIKALSYLKALSDDWVNLALADPSAEVKDALIKGLVDSASGKKLLDRNFVPNELSYEWLRLKVLHKHALTSNEQAELLNYASSSQDALLLYLLQLPREERLSWLLENQGTLPYQSFVLAIGQVGDVAAIPSLLHAITHSEKYHRVSAQAFAAITGFDLANPDHLASEWNGEPESNYDKKDQRKDNVYPWVSVAALTAWWKSKEHEFESGQFYLLGKSLQETVSQPDYPNSQPLFILNRIRYERYFINPTSIHEWHSYRVTESL